MVYRYEITPTLANYIGNEPPASLNSKELGIINYLYKEPTDGGVTITQWISNRNGYLLRYYTIGAYGFLEEFNLP